MSQVCVCHSFITERLGFIEINFYLKFYEIFFKAVLKSSIVGQLVLRTIQQLCEHVTEERKYGISNLHLNKSSMFPLLIPGLTLAEEQQVVLTSREWGGLPSPNKLP